MSAKRYSGTATITISLDDSFGKREPGRQTYRVTIAQGRKRSSMDITAPIRSASGVSVDSPIMFDEVARTALSFATNDGEIDEDALEFDDGWKVRRKK